MAIRLTDIHDLTTERLYISSHDTGDSVKAILSQDSATFVRFTSLKRIARLSANGETTGSHQQISNKRRFNGLIQRIYLHDADSQQ